jgi:hypothetical protein
MNTPEFVCRPVRAETVNDDGTPSSINECPLADAQWIGVYRYNNLDENPTARPSDWMFDIVLDPNDDPASREKTLSMARGVCDMLSMASPESTEFNPDLQVFFE